MTFIVFDDLELTIEANVRKSKRFQRATFGDGYSQILNDGLNAETEIWTCVTPPLPSIEAFSVESYLKRFADSPIEWNAPDSTKTFRLSVSTGEFFVGYTNLASMQIQGYSPPANYTRNLLTGTMTSVNIPIGQSVLVTVVESPKKYLLRDGWQLSYLNDDTYQLSFELERVYV